MCSNSVKWSGFDRRLRGTGNQKKSNDPNLHCCENTFYQFSESIDLVQNRLVQWMGTSGFTMNKCHLKPFEFNETGRGLIAAMNIYAGDSLIEVPCSLIITSRTVMSSYLKDSIKSFRLTPLAALCVFLVCERCRGSSSPWHPYLLTLPYTYTVPVYWPSDLVERLPVAIKQHVLDQRKTVHKLYNKCQKIFNDVGQFCDELKDNDISIQDFIWAWGTVNTRCVYWLQKPDPDLEPDGEDHYALVPFLDMLNHSHQAQVTAGYNERSKSYKISTDTAYSAGQQVFINYGPHSNMKLLLEYGFILENNPNNVIHIGEEDFLSALQNHRDVSFLHLIYDNDLYKGRALSVEGPTWSLQTSLKIAALQCLDNKHDYKSRWFDCMEENYYVSVSHKTATRGILFRLLHIKMQQFQYEMQDPHDPLEKIISKLCADYQQIVRLCLQGM